MKYAMLLAVALLMGAIGCEKKDNSKTLNLYVWSEYIPDEVLAKFTEKTGVKVNVEYFDSNEKLLEKLESGAGDYDVCTPSDYMVRALIEKKLLAALDRSKIPNAANLDARFLAQPYDPSNAYSLPFLWGTTGLAYNKQAVSGPVDSWKVVFDEKHAGKILMLDDMRECFAVALKTMGKSINTTHEPTLRLAAEMLANQKKLVKTYSSEEYDELLRSGDVALSHGYNGELAKLAMEMPDKFAYVMPKEGGTRSIDNLCIPAKAKNPEAAHAFINFINEATISADIVNAKTYASANSAAKAHIKPEILNDPAIYPGDDVLKNCESMEDIGPALELIDRLWTEIKAK